jgi:hypothetical protein
MQLTPREAQQHPDTAVQLIDRLESALAERDHHSTEARRYRLLAEAADAALKEARSEAAAALAIAERAQRERDEARTVARRLLRERNAAHRHEECPHCGVCLDCAPTGAKVYTDDDPDDCRDCGLPLECVRPGNMQCPDAGVCQRCGHVTHNGVCSGGCYPRDYSELP